MKVISKKSVFITLMLFAGTTYAESSYYKYIPYYNNNVFLFCTIGVPEDCWTPVSAELGTYTVTSQYCFNPTSANLFAEVCPHGFSQADDSAEAWWLTDLRQRVGNSS